MGTSFFLLLLRGAKERRARVRAILGKGYGLQVTGYR